MSIERPPGASCCLLVTPDFSAGWFVFSAVPLVARLDVRWGKLWLFQLFDFVFEATIVLFLVEVGPYEENLTGIHPITSGIIAVMDLLQRFRHAFIILEFK